MVYVLFVLFQLLWFIILFEQMIETQDNLPSTPRHRIKRSKKSRKGNKVIEDDFSPRSLRLAVKAKTFLRKSIAIDNPFPKTVPVEAKDRFVWSILQEAAEGNETLEQVLHETNSEFKRLHLTSFVRINL